MSENQDKEREQYLAELDREAQEVASVDWSDPEQSGDFLFQTALMQQARNREKDQEGMETELLQDKNSANGMKLSMGMNPELMLVGMRLAGYHIEAGSRQFSKYGQAMIEDLGEGVRPYLKFFYNAVRDWPDAVAAGLTQGMDSRAEVERLHAEYQEIRRLGLSPEEWTKARAALTPEEFEKLEELLTIGQAEGGLTDPELMALEMYLFAKAFNT